MKLRIQGNSVRVRLTRAGVDRLGAGQRVEQVTVFAANSTMVSAVEPSPDASSTSVEFEGGHVTLLIPFERARAWATSSDEVAIRSHVNAGADQPLSILIEKDFQCLHSDDPADPDAFPNPNAALVR